MRREVKEASFGFSEKDLFSELSFSLEEGEICAVLGPNGSGKTTLLRCLIGMYPLRSGQVLLDGRPVSEMSNRDFWKKVAYVPQARMPVSDLTVFDSVLLGRTRLLGPFSSPGEEDEMEAEKIMQKLKIDSLSAKRVREVSGGELQMTLIARALVSHPEILILDEPESNLDYKNRLMVMETVDELSKGGISCLFNTHYPEHALRWAAKSLLLYGGEWAFGKSGDIVSEEMIGKAFGVESLILSGEKQGKKVPTVVPIGVRDPKED